MVGATYPQAIKEVRQMTAQMPLLIPGIGTQGGDLKAVLQNGLNAEKTGLVINVSRAVIFASDSDSNFATAVANQAQRLCQQINQYRFSIEN